MAFVPNRLRLLAVAVPALVLGACTSTFTGPVEVTRFTGAQPEALGQGVIGLAFPEDVEDRRVAVAFESAVAAELARLGYTIDEGLAPPTQVAAIRTSRSAIESTGRRRGPVTVGGGAGTGSFGSGVGLGVGINLGGGGGGPQIATELSVRITAPSGETLWEGRSELATSVNSPYSDVETGARALASALFKDFPGGNGETVSIDVDELEGTQ